MAEIWQKIVEPHCVVAVLMFSQCGAVKLVPIFQVKFCFVLFSH